MTATLPPRTVAGLRGRLAGRLVLPGEQGYEAARQVWNASHDYRPALVVQPLSAADVRAAVRFAGDRGLPVCVRGGGHNHAGYAVADGALMLDLSAMVSVRVDPARRTATVGGGATWGVVDQATQAAGLAVTGADVPAVGVGGSTLGGGAGWLHRTLGLSCDNLIAAEVVTADAQVVRVVGGGARGAVVGAARRRRELRRGHLVHLRPAPGRPGGADRGGHGPGGAGRRRAGGVPASGPGRRG